jgi:hypothetical protein
VDCAVVHYHFRAPGLLTGLGSLEAAGALAAVVATFER